MGTRSTVHVVENDKTLLSVYIQFDGYPEGVGKDLFNFLKGGRIVNGIPVGIKDKVFNGVEDLAIRLVCMLKEYKDTPGNVYLTNSADSQQYDYFINVNEQDIVLHCFSGTHCLFEFINPTNDTEFVYKEE